MKKIALCLFATLSTAVGCTKDKEVQLCNPQTLLVNFTCGADLAAADGIDFHVVRDDGVDVRFSTRLTCPGKRAFQVNIPEYPVGRAFSLTAVPTKAAAAIAASNTLSAVTLTTNCTAVEFPLSASGKSPNAAGDGGLADLDGGFLPDATTDGASCTPGAIGCSCTDGACTRGLTCRAGTCISPTCGNGQVDPGEDCDQGASNTNDVDLCSVNCVSCSKRPGFLACGEACLAGAECCPGDPCGPAALCSTNVLLMQSLCASDGKCPTAKPAPCDSYLTCADSASCRTTCSSDGECTGERRCQNGTCITPSCGNGKQETGEQCDDGNTNDVDACSNACVACSNRPGFLGCGARCIQGATCCPGSVCGAATCIGSTSTASQTCGADGQCPVGTPTSCAGNFVCEAGTCKTSCASSSQCANGRVCMNGDCITPVCGNGVLEPTEQCDNGANNGDAKSCSSKCENCASRVGMKDCGGGVCVPAGGLNCCADVDCPLASTSGKCDGTSHTCWLRETVVLRGAPEKTGRYSHYSNAEGCLLTDYIEATPRVNGRNDGLVSFDGPLPAGTVLEFAYLSAVQRAPGSGSIVTSYGKLRATPCKIFSCLPANAVECAQADDDPVLCTDASLEECVVDVTASVRSGHFAFVLAFPTFVNASLPSCTFFASGPYTPKLTLTILKH